MRFTRKREPLTRAVLLVGTVMISWFAMMVVHESGHVIGAWMSGGTVKQVILRPLQISRTIVDPNPSPGIVVWAGPIMGVTGPLLLWGVAAWRQWSAAYLLRFFAGFCCVANGAYIGAGIIQPVGDANVMLVQGSPAWLLAAFGVTMVPVGLFLWSGQGRHFGLGKDREAVNPSHALWLVGLLNFIVIVDWIQRL